MLVGKYMYRTKQGYIQDIFIQNTFVHTGHIFTGHTGQGLDCTGQTPDITHI